MTGTLRGVSNKHCLLSFFICSCLPKYPIDWILLRSYYLANSLVCRLVPFLMDIGGQLKSSRLF